VAQLTEHQVSSLPCWVPDGTYFRRPKSGVPQFKFLLGQLVRTQAGNEPSDSSVLVGLPTGPIHGFSADSRFTLQPHSVPC
jgi:hypothetical protein